MAAAAALFTPTPVASRVHVATATEFAAGAAPVNAPDDCLKR